MPADGLSHLRVTLSEDLYVGPGRADLLEGIARTGSISAAAKAMDMSYRRAWALIQALNEGFGTSLVETERGGQAQGGARLTPVGIEVLATYRAMQASAGVAIAKDTEKLRALMAPRGKS